MTNTINGLLARLPASYEVHTNNNTVYNTQGHDYLGNDYSIEIMDEGYEICHTGNTIKLNTVHEVLRYITN